MRETLEGWEEVEEEGEVEEMERGSEEVREDRPDMSEGEGDPNPADPKLESKETSEPEEWEKVREEREWEIGEVVDNPVREWQCFNILNALWTPHQRQNIGVFFKHNSHWATLITCSKVFLPQQEQISVSQNVLMQYLPLSAQC